MNHQTTAAVILAAGESGRMGTFKPLLPLGKSSVLERVVGLFQNAGLSDIRVVIGHRGEEIRHRLASLQVTWIHNDNYRQGMLSSIKVGLQDLAADRTGFFILPVDIPLVRPRTIAAMLEKWSTLEKETSILYPSFLDERGHPPLISARLIPEILKWERQGGLNTFLESRKTEARDLSVIDEYILKDMDTRSDYEHITAARNRYDIPTAAECIAILKDPGFVSDTTASHCLTVSKLAVYLGSQIVSRNSAIHLSRISAAALLHDVAKGRPNHAHKGAALLSELGFPGIADIVAGHMDIDFPEDAPLTDREMVYLADKLVKGDSVVSPSVRFDDKLARHGHDPDVKSAILKRKDDALRIVRRLEEESGKQLQRLLDEFTRNAP
jgi:molybdenum cofactor cytidylyltransferase